jgi:hypothetical protein
MPVTGDVNQEKDFMITKFCSLLRWTSTVLILGMAGCAPDLSDDAIPVQPFADIVINLTLPAYSDLNTDKGFEYINGGIRGIIIYRFSSASYYAYERNCSYHPNDACATINVDQSGLFMVDPCCKSTFDFPDANPTGGAAWRPLLKYKTLLSGSTLTITDDVVE